MKEEKWKNIGRKQAYILLWKLKDALSSAQMERADFSDEIKDKTKLYRESWIIRPLEESIKMLEDNYKL